MESSEFKERMADKLTAAEAQEEKTFTGFFIRNYRFTYLLVFAVLILGLFSVFTLPREANPEIKVPFAVVTAILPGSTPTDTEELLTNKIEEKIKNLDDLRQYSSGSGQGVSSIFVEFDANADLQDSFQKLREAVDEAKPNLPPEAEDPITTEISFSDIPIITYSLVGDLSDGELKKYAGLMRDEFEDIANVSKVPVLGGLEREFQVIISQTKLAHFNVSLGQVMNAIARANFNLPAGDIEIDGFKYNVRVQGKFTNAEALNDIVIATYDNSPLYLRDLGLVKDSFKEKKTESRIGFKDAAPRNTISLQIFKKTGGNILNIVEESQKVITRLQESKALPADITIKKTNDNSVWIKDDLNTLGRSGIQTMILIVLILLIVLSWRGAFITGLSVPIAFLMAFVALKATGQTLNSLVLFSLVLSLGLMVDNSIIIIEGINEYVSKYKKNAYQAAMLSVWNFKWAITSGTMTTVSAFLPLLLVSGILGEFLKVMPITIAATLISSLLVSLIIIPTLISRFLKISVNGQHQPRNKKRHAHIENCVKYLKERYISFLRWILPSKKKRRLAIAIAWVFFFMSVAIPVSGLMKIEMFPSVDIDYFIVNIRLPADSVLDKTRAVTEEVERIVASIPEMDNYVTNIGTAQSLGLSDDMGGGGSGSHLANITVNLVDESKRDRKSFAIAEFYRPQFAAIQGAIVTAEELSAGPPTGSPIEVRIFGDDLEKLADTADIITAYFKNIPGVINVKDSIGESTGDFTFTINKQLANYYGLDIAAIASTLRNALFGAKASTATIDGEDIDITVKFDQAKFTSVNDLENVLLFTPAGANIPLKQVADLKLEPSLLSISHRDGQRVVTVTGGTEADVNIADVFAGFNEFKKTIDLPAGVNLDIGGELEDIQQSFQEIFLSMIVAIILIAFILVLQFNSFRQPFIIIFTLPLAIIGVMFGLNILRLSFSFTVFIGLVALSGIVVNDAIVLIDRVNKNLKNGMNYLDGIVEGGLARMQPIFLTTLTTVAGIFPLIFADELWRGLAITIIFGLIFSTILTLVMVPIVYTGFCFKEKN